MTEDSIMAQVHLANVHMALELGIITREQVPADELELIDALRMLAAEADE